MVGPAARGRPTVGGAPPRRQEQRRRPRLEQEPREDQRHSGTAAHQQGMVQLDFTYDIFPYISDNVYDL